MSGDENGELNELKFSEEGDAFSEEDDSEEDSESEKKIASTENYSFASEFLSNGTALQSLLTSVETLNNTKSETPFASSKKSHISSVSGTTRKYSRRKPHLFPAMSPTLPNGKKTKGRVKIKMEYIGNKLRRYTTFSKRKTGIMKKANELSTLTGTQVLLLVASETGHIYAYATHKLKPMIETENGKNFIQNCLNNSNETADEGPINISFTFDQPPNTTFDQQSSKEVGAIGGAINQASTSTNAQSSSRKRKFPAAQETSIDNLFPPTMVAQSSHSPSLAFEGGRNGFDDDCINNFGRGEGIPTNDTVPDQSNNPFAALAATFGEADTSSSFGQDLGQLLTESLLKQQQELLFASATTPTTEVNKGDKPKRSKKTPQKLCGKEGAVPPKQNSGPGFQQCSPSSLVDIQQLQKTLKEALKAAADQRQRQKRKTNANTVAAALQQRQNQQQQQQMNVVASAALLPLLLQLQDFVKNGITSSSPRANNTKGNRFEFELPNSSPLSSHAPPFFQAKKQKCSPTIDQQKKGVEARKERIEAKRELNNSTNGTILYQMPQGTVYASESPKISTPLDAEDCFSATNFFNSSSLNATIPSTTAAAAAATAAASNLLFSGAGVSDFVESIGGGGNASSPASSGTSGDEATNMFNQFFQNGFFPNLSMQQILSSAFSGNDGGKIGSGE